MNQQPTGNRTHIGIFGRCNVGKSSLLNAITGQQAAIVSPQTGTTTDPVYKTMELLPLGAVVLIDTPGLDDTSLVGEQRIAKTKEVLRKTELALVVLAGDDSLTVEEDTIVALLKERKIPFLLVENKGDLKKSPRIDVDYTVSSTTGEGMETLKKALAALVPQMSQKSLLDGIVEENQLVVLVTPIDEGAPKGRLILPQQQTIRAILEAHSATVVTQPEELEFVLGQLKSPPALVITDSQVFRQVGKILPKEIPLTSFSILFARFKGILVDAVDGVSRLDNLQSGDKILICEGCTHHRQCEDIGTTKIPQWILEHTKKTFDFTFVSGGEYPEDLTPYQLIIHCGGCMLNNREMESRLAMAKEQQVPMTNYGILISMIHGTLERSIAMFDEV